VIDGLAVLRLWDGKVLRQGFLILYLFLFVCVFFVCVCVPVFVLCISN